jgi:monoterpene epsilon-lactone hydrolase
MKRLSYDFRSIVGATALALIMAGPAQAQQAAAPAQPRPVTVDPDGATHIPDVVIPFSSLASPEAKKAYLDLIAHPYPTSANIDEFRRGMDTQFFGPQLARFKVLYPVEIESKMIADVRTDIITPKEGVATRNKSRILINVHGGGFVIGGGGISGQVESIPIASLGRFKVISIDYRMFPEHKFPAASEDVAAVYAELLKQYNPENIGIYGCSAGGILTAQSVAWFQKHDLPRPGAIGIICASAGASVRAIPDLCGHSIRRNHAPHRAQAFRHPRRVIWQAPIPRTRWSHRSFRRMCCENFRRR